MTRRGWALILCCGVGLNLSSWSQTPTSPPSSTADWGPTSGEVTWSLREYALTWTTPRLDLHLDPWITFRHVSGTTNSVAEAGQELSEPWDNLRGAHFQARLDNRWTVAGSLEEMQGIPGVWEAVTMGEATALPGWGRAKRTSGHRVDVARARVESQLHSPLSSGDSLVWQAAYAPYQWGKLSSSLTFSDEAASFPRYGVRWLGTQGLSCAAHVARWTGTERSPDGGSTESLFRQSDALWTQAQWQGRPSWNVGLLSGMVKARPWTGELAQDSTGAFAWKPWASAVAAWTSSNGQLSFAGEWTTHQGWGLGTTWAASKTLTCEASLTKLSGMTDAGWAMQHAGTPVSSAIRPFGSEDAWRVEASGQWTCDRLSFKARAASAAGWRAGECWIGWTLQQIWPLRASLGVEVWQGAHHPWLPAQGTRLRVGVSHRMGMTPGSTTFEAP